MATEEDSRKPKDEVCRSRGARTTRPKPRSKSRREGRDPRRRAQDELDAEEAGKADDAAREAAASPMQLGYMRFVYAAYMAGAMLVALPRREDRPRRAGTASVSGSRSSASRATRSSTSSPVVVGVVRRALLLAQARVAPVRERGRRGALEGHLAEPQGSHELDDGRSVLHAVRDRLLRAHGSVLEVRHRQDLQLLIEA